MAPKEKLIIKTKEGLTSNEKKQSEIIAKYFKNIFYTKAKPMQKVLPTPMSTLFTSSEIRKAVWTRSNGPRKDQINVELIKYSPEVVYDDLQMTSAKQYQQQRYADDISKISTSISAIEKMKDKLPVKLAQQGLKINEAKTEEYTIKRANCDNRWRDCKLLGSLLDTQNDIKRRKVLAINAANKLKHLFSNKDVKTKLFKSYITPTFLYNFELWTLTNNMQRKLDSFQRRIIRTFVLNVRWPTIVKNEEILNKTKLEPWSIIIGKRRLKWYGKIARLDPSTSACSTLHHALEEFRRHRGRPPKTWLSIMKQQLRSELNMNWN